MQVGAIGRVGNGGSIPVIKESALVFTVKEKTTLTESLNQKKYVEDVDGNPLTFAVISPPTWAKLTAQGVLTLTPLHGDLGKTNLKIEVSNSTGKAQGTIAVTVAADVHPPLWLEDPVALGAVVNQAFSATLAEKVKEFSGLSLTFRKVSGPAWLNVAADGRLTGTPSSGNSGLNGFRVSASNGTETVEGAVNITVRSSLFLYRIPLDEPVSGAATEVLWAIDNSSSTSPYLPSLIGAASQFYGNLDGAGIAHTSGVLSTRDWSGKLIPDLDDNPTLQGHGATLAMDFRRRVERAYTGQAYNSPIWSLFKLYDVVTTSGQQSKGFWTEGLPMEVFILTASSDSFRRLSSGTAQAAFGVGDFGREFSQFHSRGGEPFSVTVYDMRCPAVYNPANPAARPDYLKLAMDTIGVYFYQAPECGDRVFGAVMAFQKDVVFRAKVATHRRIALDRPAVLSRLQVQLLKHGGLIRLPGNTGASDDVWSYDSKEQEVVVRWDRVRIRLQPGDELQITY